MNDSIRLNPIQTSRLPLKEKILIEAWNLVQSTFFRYSPRRMNGFRRFLLVCFGAKLARNVSVHNTARIHCPWNLEMKEKSSLGEYSWIYTLGRISVGECSCVGQHVFLLTGTHDYTDTTFPLVIKPIEIGYGCWLAVGARILPGVTIGDYAVIGAGSVVAKNVEPWAVVAGNPARFIKKRILKETA